MNTSPRTRVAALGLVVGALLFTTGDLLRRIVEPSGPASTTAITDAVDHHALAWSLGGLVSVAAAFCLVPGILGLLDTARGRGARVTTVGALLVGVGAIASVGHAVAFYSPYALYGLARTPGSQQDALDRASESYPMLALLIVLFIVGMVIGPVVLFVGLRRAGRVPIWAVVAAIVFVVTGSTNGVAAGGVGVLAALAAFVPAARSLTAPSGEAGEDAVVAAPVGQVV
ncbi:MAG: hypothetical protein ABIQ61_10565 [Ornithinibacter sp.]